MTDASKCKSERELMEWVIAHCEGGIDCDDLRELFTDMKLVPVDAVELTVEDAEQIERIATLPISTHARLVKAITEAKEKKE
jgi:hypothetical protein